LLIFFCRDINISLFVCVRRCSPYFSATSTQEILDELRPRMCPIESSFVDVIDTFQHLLPLHLPLDLHDQGFKFVYFLLSRSFLFLHHFRLWLPEFFGIWESVCNQSAWELVSSLIDVAFYHQ
jgi:proteasome activator subunit 4